MIVVESLRRRDSPVGTVGSLCRLPEEAQNTVTIVRAAFTASTWTTCPATVPPTAGDSWSPSPFGFAGTVSGP